MAINFDWGTILAAVLLGIMLAGVLLARRSNPGQRLRLEIKIERREPDEDERLVIRVTNLSLREVTLGEVEITLSNRQPYHGRAWCAKSEGLWVKLDPGRPTYEFCLHYPDLIGELHAQGVSLKDVWVIDMADMVYAYRIPREIIQRMTMDLQKANEVNPTP